MKELKKKRFLLLAAAVLFLIAGLYLDLSQGKGLTSVVERAAAGEDAQTYEFVLDAEDVLEDYEYSLSVDAVLMDEDTIAAYLEAAEQEIEETFYADGESADAVTQDVCMKESYADGMVSAEWYLDDYETVSADGAILSENLDEDGTIVTATVQLSCGETKQLYQFAFVVYPAERSQAEQLLYDIRQNLLNQQSQTGVAYLTLPDEVDGITLVWSEKKEHYFLKILFFELILLIGLPFVIREREKETRKNKELQMQMDYPVIVSKFLILYSSGMSISQIWNRLAGAYLDKKEKGYTEIRYAYEELVTANRQILDGESESAAWISFGERTGLRCYHRFARLLAENRRKGAQGWSSRLEREAEDAFAERRNLARKLGEEAGTKLLLPMILMFGIVMAIVIMPAIRGYLQ